MSKTAYACEGDFQMGRIRQHFRLEVVANDEKGAHDAVLAELGSRHGVKRREVDVQSVKVLAADEASDITQKRLG